VFTLRNMDLDHGGKPAVRIPSGLALTSPDSVQ
jgi:hypothetical protein